MDLFGHPITLKYKNKSTFKSTLGGIASIIVITGMLAYLLTIFEAVFNRNRFQVINSIQKKNMAFDKTPIHLTKDNFDIGIWMYFNGNDTIANDIDLYFQYNLQIGYFQYAINDQQKEEFGNSYQLLTQNLTLELCGPSRFGGEKLGAKELGITNTFYCPKDDFNFTLYGSFSSNQAQIIQVYVHYCTQNYLDSKFPGMNKKCKPQSEADKIINQVQMYLPLMTQYFDQSDFGNEPIKSSIDMNMYQIPNPNLSINKVYKISQNKVTLQDSRFSSLVSAEEKTYIDYKFTNDYFPRVDLSENLPLITIQFILDETSNSINRKVDTIFDGFAQIGGFFTLTIIVARNLLFWYQEFKFRSRILQSLFFVHSDDMAKYSEQSQEVKGPNGMNTSGATKDGLLKINLNKAPPDNFSNAFQLRHVKTFSEQFVLHLGTKMNSLEDNEEARLNELFDYMRNLKHFVYKIKDFLKFKLITMIGCFRKKRSSRLNDQLYKVGVKRIESQFDIIEVFRALRKIHLITQISLSKYQQSLLPYLKHNVLAEEDNLEQQQFKDKAIDIGPENTISERDKNDQDNDNDGLQLISKERLYIHLRNLLFNSKTSKIDQRILKDLTKLKDHQLLKEAASPLKLSEKAKSTPTVIPPKFPLEIMNHKDDLEFEKDKKLTLSQTNIRIRNAI